MKEQNRPWVLGCLYSAACKTQGLLFFLSLHHPNNRLENTFIFPFFPLFNSAAKEKKILEKILEGHLPPPLHPPSYAYAYNIP